MREKESEIKVITVSLHSSIIWITDGFDMTLFLLMSANSVPNSKTRAGIELLYIF